GARTYGVGDLARATRAARGSSRGGVPAHLAGASRPSNSQNPPHEQDARRRAETSHPRAGGATRVTRPEIGGNKMGGPEAALDRSGLVGARGFEPPTSWSRTTRSSQAEPRPDDDEEALLYHARRRIAKGGGLSARAFRIHGL